MQIETAIERIRAFAGEKGLFTPADRILLAVSGGMDSMCMLHLLRCANQPLEVAHVNYQLRGADSERDARLVAQYCAQHDLRSHVLQANIPDGSNVQISAREIRYQWFEELLDRQELAYVATAHHLDDAIETFFINLLRGTGLKGLTGIPARRNRVVRPMLCFDRQMISTIVRQVNVPFGHDTSNDEDTYLRNRIRSDLIPRLTELQSAVRERMARNMERLSSQSTLLQQCLEVTYSEAVHRTSREVRLDLPRLRTAAAPSLVLHHFIAPFGFTISQCEDAIAPHQSGTHFLSESHRMTVDRDQLLITSLEEEIPDPVRILRGKPKRSQWGTLHVQEVEEFVKSSDRYVETIDGHACSETMTLRRWQAGDRFCPLGVGGTQKVKDFLTNQKVPVPHKKHALVLTCGDQIVWLVGHRIDERYKVHSDTTHYLRLSWEPSY